jgi:hypothetical protein
MCCCRLRTVFLHKIECHELLLRELASVVCIQRHELQVDILGCSINSNMTCQQAELHHGVEKFALQLENGTLSIPMECSSSYTRPYFVNCSALVCVEVSESSNSPRATLRNCVQVALQALVKAQKLVLAKEAVVVSVCCAEIDFCLGKNFGLCAQVCVGSQLDHSSKVFSL